jgi:DinB superfamily
MSWASCGTVPWVRHVRAWEHQDIRRRKNQERHALTIEQRRNALKYLTETRDAVKRHVTNLTEAQWNFKPSEQRWSILDVLEHLVIFETILIT